MTAQPEPEAPKVVVTPIPPVQSRTLRLTRRLTWLTPIIGFLPDALALIVNLWATDPAFAAAISGLIPVQYRAIIVVIVMALAQKYGQLRRVTTAPIAGTPAESQAMRLMPVAIICLLALGCASARLQAGHYADKILHPGNPKVLAFSGNFRGEISKVEWRRLCDITDCTIRGPERGDGIFTPTPKACYSRWWNECAVEGCAHCRKRGCGKNWWEKCAKQENAKAITTRRNE